MVKFSHGSKSGQVKSWESITRFAQWDQIEMLFRSLGGKSTSVFIYSWPFARYLSHEKIQYFFIYFYISLWWRDSTDRNRDFRSANCTIWFVLSNTTAALKEKIIFSKHFSTISLRTITIIQFSYKITNEWTNVRSQH